MSRNRSSARIRKPTARDLAFFEGHLEHVYREDGTTEAGLNLVYAYEGQGKYDEALALLESMLAKSNSEVKLAIFMRMAEVCESADRLGEACGHYEQALAGGMDEALLSLARLKMREGDPSSAEVYLHRAVEAGVKGAEELFGDVLAHEDNWEGALAHFEHVYSEDSSAAGKLGVCLLNVGRAEEALPYLRESVGSGNLAMTRRLVQAYFSVGKFRNGIIYGEMGIARGLKELYGFVALGYMRLLKYEKAADYLERSIRSREEDCCQHLSLGQCYMELRRYDEALRQLRLSTRHKDPNAWFYLGLLYRRMDHGTAAFRCFKRSLEVQEEQSALASFELSKLCGLRKDLKGQEMYLQDSWLGGYMEAGVALGGQAMMRGDIDMAISWYQKVLDRGDTQVLARLGIAYLAKGDRDKARELLLRAHEAGQPEAALGLGLVCKEEENLEEMDRFFEEAIEQGAPGILQKYGRDLLRRKEYLSAMSYLLEAWQEDGDKEALVPLAQAFLADAGEGNLDAALHYLDLAMREGVLPASVHRKLRKAILDGEDGDGED